MTTSQENLGKEEIFWENSDVLMKMWQKIKHQYIFIALWEHFGVRVSNFINLRFVVLFLSLSRLVYLCSCLCVFDIKINEFDVFNAQYAVIIHNEQETTTATNSINKSARKHGVWRMAYTKPIQSYTSVNNHDFSIWFHLLCFYFIKFHQSFACACWAVW